MKETLKTLESEVGSADGYWLVAEGGFVWDNTLREDPHWTSLQHVKPLQEGYSLWLRPAVSGRGRRYPVLRDRQVMRDFVKLGRDVTEESIVEFANRWGWLGVPREVRMLWDSTPEFIRREAVFKWESGGKSGVIINAEPMALWEKEARWFAILWETWEAVQEVRRADPDRPKLRRDARRLLEERVRWNSSRSVLFQIGNLDARDTVYRRDTIALSINDGDAADTLLRRWQKGDVVETARYYVHREVNRGLLGKVNMMIQPYRAGPMGQSGRIRFFPTTLLAALYMHFAFELGGIQGEERRCANPRCPNGGVFFPSRSDQRTCNKRCYELAYYYKRKGKRTPA